MFGLTRRSPFEDLFNFQREMDRLFNQFWSGLPASTSAQSAGSFRVQSGEDGWRVEVPMPGIDPKHVSLEVAGTTISIRAEVPGEDEKDRPQLEYEQTLTVPQFLDIEKLHAAHRHGLLVLSLPLKESVKPRRVEIATEDKKQLAA
jgi:HSP20 family protein